MDLDRVEIVLVRPSRPANVAAACRAMKNMGLRRLCLVGAPPGLETHEARRLAYGAWDVLDGARAAPSLTEAVRDSTCVAATTGRNLEGAWTSRRLAAEAEPRAAGGTLSVVFGPEASGLRGDELDRSHVLVHVPTDPAQPSLNLAQAVLLVAYELRLAALAGTAAAGPGPEERPAPAGELEGALLDLRAALLEIGYLNPESPELVLTELRRLAARALPSAREVCLLRGLARQVAWAGRIARGRGPVS